MHVCDRIMVVESEKPMVNLIRTILQDYHVVTALSGNEALTMIGDFPPDLVLLDFDLPDMSVLDFIKSVRTWTSLPIIVLSSTMQTGDEVKALTCGADDYLQKPFTPAQLLAHVCVAIRHARQGGADTGAYSGKYTTGELTVDFDKHEVCVAGENCGLTQSEFRIVALLAKYAGRILTYDFILKELWGPDKQRNNQILRVNMANIRRKIEKDTANPRYIFTKVGVGYWMAGNDA